MTKRILKLTDAELDLLDTAVRVRAESCEDNHDCEEDQRQARRWRRLLSKIEGARS